MVTAVEVLQLDTIVSLVPPGLHFTDLEPVPD